jgi:hypothetical protein
VQKDGFDDKFNQFKELYVAHKAKTDVCQDCVQMKASFQENFPKGFLREMKVRKFCTPASSEEELTVAKGGKITPKPHAVFEDLQLLLDKSFVKWDKSTAKKDLKRTWMGRTDGRIPYLLDKLGRERTDFKMEVCLLPEFLNCCSKVKGNLSRENAKAIKGKTPKKTKAEKLLAKKLKKQKLAQRPDPNLPPAPVMTAVTPMPSMSIMSISNDNYNSDADLDPDAGWPGSIEEPQD